MKDRKINIKTIVIILLICINIILIFINLNNKNLNIEKQEKVKEQLGETSSDSAYILMEDHLAEVSSSGGSIIIPKLTATSEGTSYAAGMATLKLDVTNYTTLTIESIKLTARGNGNPYCKIVTDDGGTIYNKSTSSTSGTTYKNLYFDISNSTTLTITLRATTFETNGSDSITNIVIN